MGGALFAALRQVLGRRVYVRTPADFSDEVESRVKKLTQKIIDFDALANDPIPAGTQAAFCCLGLREPSKHS